MKRYQKKRPARYGHETERLIARKIRQEEHGGFKCSHCKQWVVINEYMGTANRNHCNVCLWSKHVDVKKGDRRAVCQAGMKPVGLTFRHEGQENRGEVMLIHDCAGCEKISINRLAADDDDQLVLDIFETSLAMPNEEKQALQEMGIYVALVSDKPEILISLFGNTV